MELGQLRALRELGERGSIAAVAAALHVTPSSVSQQISALQRHTSTPLTYKEGRRTALTAAGRALAAAAIEVEVALERAEQAIADFRSDTGGAVSVAAFHSAGLAVFGPLLGALDDPPGPEVTLTDFDVAQTEFPALTATQDLVIAHRLSGSPDWPSSVAVRPLLFEPLDVAMRRDHPLAQRTSIRPEDLRDEDWIAVHEGFPLERAVGAIGTVAGQEPRIVHRINEFLIAATVVAAGNGIALLPRYTVRRELQPELVLRPLELSALGRHVDALARPESLERAAVRTVLGHLERIAAGLENRVSTP